MVLPLLAAVAQGFAAFCLASSAVYVMNDIVDVDKDRLHPVKRHRPLAAGAVSPRGAMAFFAMLLVLSSLLAAPWQQLNFFLLMCGYVVLNAAYSLVLQKVFLADALSVAGGFVIRVFSGSVLIGVRVSWWLTAMTLLLALFIAFAKRRCDLVAMNETGGWPGRQYSRRFLSRAVKFLAALSCLLYIGYTLWPPVIQEHGTGMLCLSALWVVPGIARYLWLVFRSGRDCAPVRSLLTDVYLQACVVLWVATLWLLIYTDML